MEAIKGRGAVSNQTSTRFNLTQSESDGDWLDEREQIDGPPPSVTTVVTELHPRTIVSFNQSPDIPFDRSINAYNGCEHGCIYCFARPSHAYHDLSPGLDFETRLFAKPDAARLLRETLARRNYRVAPIAMGTNTDPYQPIERRYRITRDILELCLEVGHPVSLVTKSDRILADSDVLAELARRDLVSVGISVTSLDARLSRLLEPRTAAPAKRFAALEALNAQGIPAHAMIAPVIPAITDHELESLVEAAAKAGSRGAMWIMLRLPLEVAPLFREWLEAHFPDRAGKVMAIIREMRGGRDNDPRFGERFRPQSPWADLVRSRFRLAMKRHRLGPPGVHLDCSQFRAPSPDGQLSLL
ncbi:PA0069 family radical SAM protein [Novosphingobium mangrovi (ex Hu et al. 2023)]|uniref:PA0069 family radical SAM protein n=1 Tax=Novosphingobium mangrovi (ex Hu et al. 2023) TaxID=2930094 RepID=A0ABT0A8I8_9SPHN|nr:PA0069 family radical SAM protein [Novosphingobium mangrovi (ex Hu et al. 2023)]MCJ1959511.1 PA0069 family radical SAM protein [Novosphingobium mangrovi (ex Hu et al. 2023)]